MLRALAIVAVLTTASSTARAGDDVSARTLVFTRGGSLIKADGRGRGETELAKLPGAKVVRALRSDATGKVLLADLGATWWWMPLDGSARTLTQLPCEAGPAQLSSDGLYVLCRGKTASLVVNLRTGKLTDLDVPSVGARLVGSGSELRVVWADAQGVWSAVPPQKKQPKKLAPQAPLRGFLPSPDGTRAVGVYADEVFEGAKKKKPADVLMVFSLDGVGARRKSIQNAVPLEWSHDSAWVLVQDGASACITLAAGGQYKCWRNFTAASISPDGKYALVLGSREKPEDRKPARTSKKQGKGKKSKGKTAKAPAKKPAPAADDGAPSGEAELPGDEHGDDPTVDDVPVAPPSGPLSLYRAELDGPFTTRPVLVTSDVDGAAVWIPTPAP